MCAFCVIGSIAYSAYEEGNACAARTGICAEPEQSCDDSAVEVQLWGSRSVAAHGPAWRDILQPCNMSSETVQEQLVVVARGMERARVPGLTVA
jgi:hypothetical protein